MDKTDLLKKCKLCAGLADGEVAALSRIIQTRRIDRDCRLFEEGDPATGFFVLLSGRARVFKSSPDGREITLHVISPGETFAEAAVFSGEGYPAHCTAIQDSVAGFIPKDAFTRLLAESPLLSLKIIASLSAFVRQFSRQVEDLSLRDVPSRLAGFLLRESGDGARALVTLKSTKAEIAASLGTVGETFSRALRKLKDAGVVRESGNKDIEILDVGRLRRVAEMDTSEGGLP